VRDFEWEQALPTAVAEPYFKVSDAATPLEGLPFDRDGNLLFVDIYNGRILRLSPDRQLTVVYAEEGLHPAGIAVHQDGRIFVASVGSINNSGYFANGSVIALNPNGSNRQLIVQPSLGHVIDDIVFDNEGGAYVAMQRQGRILVFSPFGVPIGQILLPGREDNHFLQCTSLAINPGSRELLIVGWDLNGRGSMIFAASGPAPGFTSFAASFAKGACEVPKIAMDAMGAQYLD